MAHSLTHASATATNVPVAARLPFLALGIVCLLTGLAGGLGRLGIALPSLRPGLVAFHGPLMVAGFLGTLVSLERAVARQRDERANLWLDLIDARENRLRELDGRQPPRPDLRRRLRDRQVVQISRQCLLRPCSRRQAHHPYRTCKKRASRDRHRSRSFVPPAGPGL